MANDELKNLRKIVNDRRKAVVAKKRRIYNATGVSVNDTKLDPTRDLKATAKYTRAQLTTYLKQLNNFMARSNNFVEGAAGTLINKGDFQRYKKLEDQVNQRAAEHFNGMKDIFIPMNGMTIEQSSRLLRPDDPRAQGENYVRPYSFIDRESSNIVGKEGLEKLNKNLKDKLQDKYLSKQISNAKANMFKMLYTIGDEDMIAAAKGLSDNQIDILWHTPFANAISTSYKFIQKTNADAGERWYDSVIEDQLGDLKEYLDWAKSLPKEKTNRGNSKK